MFLTVTSSFGFVSANNESEEYLKFENNKEEERIGQKVKATDNDEFNKSFDDGYSGYCIDYMKTEAYANDTFIVQDTSYAQNNIDNSDVSNLIKTFFVNNYNIVMNDEVRTQHYIWAFTDNFTGWRLNNNIIKETKITASTLLIPDHGARININETTDAIFDFEVLFKPDNAFQSYFAYKITHIAKNWTDGLLGEAIPEPDNSTKNENPKNSSEILPSNNLTQNITSEKETDKNNPINITESDENTSDIISTDSLKNQTIKSTDNIENNNNSTSKNQENEYSIQLSENTTGHSLIIGFIALILIAGIIIAKYKRD